MEGGAGEAGEAGGMADVDRVVHHDDHAQRNSGSIGCIRGKSREGEKIGGGEVTEWGNGRRGNNAKGDIGLGSRVFRKNGER